MKSVLISIQPKWCELIASGNKTVEVRKTRPKLETPFKVYIYCTKNKEKLIEVIHEGDEVYGFIHKGKPNFIKTFTKDWSVYGAFKGGKVIGEFVCDKIDEHICTESKHGLIHMYHTIPLKDLTATCVGWGEIENYGYGNPLYFWHISNLVIYDNPSELSDFYKPCENLINGSCELPFPFNPCSKTGMVYERFGKNGEHLRLVEKNACLNVLHRPPQSWCYVESEVNTNGD